jgi:hypothetical protein
MLALGNNSALHTFVGSDHNPFSNSNAAMDLTVEFTRDFMLDYVCPEDDGILGDLNDDNMLNVQDIILMINMILGVDESNDDADLSGDGVINILDVIQLMNLILGN